MLRTACLFTALSVFASTPALAQGDFCTDFFGIYDAKEDGFKTLRGAYDRDVSNWVALRRPPGAQDCYIQDWESTADYICSWHEPEAPRAAEAMAEGIRQCLKMRGIDTGPTPRASAVAFSHRMSVYRIGKPIRITAESKVGRAGPIVFLMLSANK